MHADIYKCSSLSLVGRSISKDFLTYVGIYPFVQFTRVNKERRKFQAKKKKKKKQTKKPPPAPWKYLYLTHSQLHIQVIITVL